MIGRLDLKQLVDIARNTGMRCICAFKYGMFVHNQIGLYGTSSQMKQTEKIWAGKGHKFTNRQPSHAYSCRVDVPETRWIDKKESDK